MVDSFLSSSLCSVPQVKLNHRRLLDAYLAIAGVPASKFRTICSAIDKLDKEPWEAVRREMVEEKGLDEDVADRIFPFVQFVGEPGKSKELLSSFLSSDTFKDSAEATAALKELALLFDYLEAMGSGHLVSFDLSLARGLDYYTGVIYEFVSLLPNNVGSVGAGGRYGQASLPSLCPSNFPSLLVSSDDQRELCVWSISFLRVLSPNLVLS